MPPQIIQNPLMPGTPEWRKTITASKAPAILGVSKYETPADIHLAMNGIRKEEPIDEVTQERFDWGHDAEDSLCKFWARHHDGVTLSDGEIAYKDEDLDFPNQVLLDRVATFPGGRQIILECKTSNDHQKWGAEGDPLPIDVFTQVFTQMGISGIYEAVVIVQVGSTIPRFYDLKLDVDLWEDMALALKKFWHSTEEAKAPPIPQELIDSIAAITTPQIEEDVLEVPVEAVSDYLAVCAEIEELVAQKEKLESEALTPLMGTHRQLKVDGYVLASYSRKFAKKEIEEAFAEQLKDDRLYEVVVQKRLKPELVKAHYPTMYEAGCTPRASFRPAVLLKKYA